MASSSSDHYKSVSISVSTFEAKLIFVADSVKCGTTMKLCCDIIPNFYDDNSLLMEDFFNGDWITRLPASAKYRENALIDISADEPYSKVHKIYLLLVRSQVCCSIVCGD